ncbi:cadmium resistance transporter [Iningainema tapete]|uniref:Cadmium resistance transporter n=1 Tax=Iningainema tapete BLCC-T55 TaxID=2748662 RepID=A0A8J6XSF7_9CYAN|nr:cadmium resistance transporter [Iningainema tapete]MBD2777499.1 cadmium resistance transporter [Iningainema tapete BLCC-T55]
MYQLFTAISTGAVAFSATNIDDIVILLLFFSQVNSTFTPRHIVVGQYLGFTILVFASLPGLLGGLILPPNLIGLLGLIPITIGINSLVNPEEDSSTDVEIEQSESTLAILSPQAYSVAVVTVANGSDNISVYVPLFASSDVGSFFTIIVVFLLLIAVWCYAAYKFSHQRAIANILTEYGNSLVPFVLIALGAFIVLKSNALSLVKLIASCACLTILVKDNTSSSDIL